MADEVDLMVSDDAAMRALGARLVSKVTRGGVISLKGDLGTGKTTLVRGALQGLGVEGSVRSPTYTLIEYYPLGDIDVAHFDLYRLADAEELEYIGYRDYLNTRTLCFVEWPQRAHDYLQEVDLEIRLEYDPAGRRVHCRAGSQLGQQLLLQLRQTAV